MRQMLRAVLAYFDQPADTARGLHIDFDSTIPVAKGLASSTADIAATALATARHLGETLEEATLAALCVSLEPTDSTLFRQLTLFDHQTAATQISYDWQPKVDILLLESPHILNTEDYHRRHRQTALLASAASLEQAWQLFTQAAERHDNALLGQSTTLSAQASQHLLVKPDFPALLALVEELDLYGLNVAHSGSVVGLLLDRQLHDIEQIYWQLHQRNISQNYPRQHLLTMVPGGVR
ncbi:Propanediol utilization [Yersinia kristensenii ATCC 33638]|nr:Propanediol utilization [Yersinia kristensenii ATCC 33638]EEP93339.1 Propanediol utilization [Yersinia kristensenii ATCC 33638]